MRLAALATLSLLATPAVAATKGECRLVDVAFQPTVRSDLSPGVNPPPQIVVWIEDASGVFVDTIFITKQTGSYGLGNRPGRFDFNSGPLWPYGRRITTFPVWAHRHGHEFPELVFQDGDDNNLSHAVKESSYELHYCRPMQAIEPNWDALTCASPATSRTDKGTFDPVKRSAYPPRSDLIFTPGDDHEDVHLFAGMNPFDAVSRATPPAGVLANLSWPLPESVPPGDYVLYVEVAKEFDHNATYSKENYPSPIVPWANSGLAYRGQPSVVYKVPFTVSMETTVASTADYAGYGDPDGLDGDLRAPDNTITTTQPGSGAARFALVAETGGMYRVKVASRYERDSLSPGAPAQMGVAEMTNSTATVSFLAPGEDGARGRVTGYEIRYRAHAPVTDENFDEPGSIDPKLAIDIGEPGSLQTFTLPGLLPGTTYFVGIRAFDDCRNRSELTVLELVTPGRESGEVDACFIATAAYGSPLAADVQMLRHVRDGLLRKTVLGELAVEAYYTFGPAAAGVIRESELLRATARELLEPIVRYARWLTF